MPLTRMQKLALLLGVVGVTVGGIVWYSYTYEQSSYTIIKGVVVNYDPTTMQMVLQENGQTIQLYVGGRYQVEPGNYIIYASSPEFANLTLGKYVEIKCYSESGNWREECRVDEIDIPKEGIKLIRIRGMGPLREGAGEGMNSVATTNSGVNQTEAEELIKALEELTQ